jgi:tetrahydromethanopterin S-methyltransferase subunit B
LQRNYCCGVTKYYIAKLEEELDDLQAALSNMTPFATHQNNLNMIFLTVEYLQEEVKELTTDKREILNSIQETTNVIMVSI